MPTFVSFLRDVESPYDVQDYVKSYLGETAKSMQFAKDFIEKRSVAKKKQAQQRLEDEVSRAVVSVTSCSCDMSRV